jgi:hypothetical protein
MTEKELKQYKEKKHRMKMNEVMNLASKLRIRATNQAIEEADSVFLSAAASPIGNSLLPPKNAASAKRKTLKNYESPNEPSHRWSKSKKKLVKTSNYSQYAKKQKIFHTKNLEAALSAAATAPVKASSRNNNNNNYKHNSSNSNSNSNRNNFRMSNWRY